MEAHPSSGQSTIDIDVSMRLHSHDCKRLKQQRQRRLAARKTGIEEGDARDDQPDQECHYDEVEVMELKSLVLSVDILDIRVAAIGLRLVEFRL